MEESTNGNGVLGVVEEATGAGGGEPGGGQGRVSEPDSLSPDAPIDDLFEVVEGVLTYVGSFPRSKVLNKILYLDMRCDLKDGVYCHRDGTLSLDQNRALSRGASRLDLKEMMDVIFSWQIWVANNERTNPNPPTNEDVRGYYLELLG